MKIAIVTAMTQETIPLLKGLGNILDKVVIADVEIYTLAWQGHTIYLARGGVGELRAALTVQLLADRYQVDAVLNMGFAGSLDSALSVGELVLVDRVCHYQFDTSRLDGTLPGQYWDKPDLYFYLDTAAIEGIQASLTAPLRRVAAASGDVFVADTPTKHRLADTFGCHICEMELAGLAMACERNRLPLVSIKAISDLADAQAEISFSDIMRLGLTHYEALLPTVLDVLVRTHADL